MPTLPILENLKVLKETVSCLTVVAVALMIDQLRFQRANEALCHRLVRTFTLATRAANQTVLGEQCLIAARGAGAALIGIEDRITGSRLYVCIDVQ